jgi:hypothetical protein
MTNPDDVINTFPDLTAEHKDDTRQCFSHYLLKRRSFKGETRYECSRCGEKWKYPQRVMTRYDNDVLDGSHRDEVRCPKCERTVTLLHANKFRNFFSLTEYERIIYIIPVNHDEVYIRVYYVSFKCDSKGFEFNYIENTRYYLAPGIARSWIYMYISSGNKWSENITIRPAFEYDLQFGANYNYRYIGKDSLTGTFLKYSQYDKSWIIENERWVNMYRLLYTYAVHPQIEMLIKLGHHSIAYDAIRQNDIHKRTLDWNADNPPDFFKLTKQEYKEFAGHNGDYRLLSYYKKFKRIDKKTTFADVENFINKVYYAHHAKFIQISRVYKIKPMRLLNYIKKIPARQFDEGFVFYRDYLDTARQIGYDLTDETVLLPKNLIEKHDTAVNIFNETKQKITEKENEEKMRKFLKITEKLNKKYSFEDEKYLIRAPESMQEIISEGRNLSHCAGGYAARHANGSTVILFLRRKDDPETSFFTIEMHGNILRQVQGYKNSVQLKGDAKEFFDDFLLYVTGKLKKTDKPKSAEAPDQTLEVAS